MSAIHEALKKAQKEKDHLEVIEKRILVSAAHERGAPYKRILALTLALSTIILLAFIAYSWLDSATYKASGDAEIKPASLPDGSESSSETDHLKESYESAKKHQSEGDLDHARILYQKTLRIDPGHVDALNDLGVVYMQTREFFAARSCLEKAIHLRPGYVEPYYNLACLYSHMGEPDKSLYYLGQAVSRDPAAAKWALQDLDLQNLRGTGEFEKITSGEGP